MLTDITVLSFSPWKGFGRPGRTRSLRATFLPTLMATLWGGLLLGSPDACAQAPAWQLAEGLSANGPSGAEVRAVATNAAGDVFVTGSFTGTATFGGFTLTNAGTSGSDIFVAKWSPASQSWAWAVAGGGSGFDVGQGIAVNGSNVYVTGSFNNDAANSNAVSFGGQAVPGSGPSANNEVFVAKYLDNGTTTALGWLTTGGGTESDIGAGIAVSGTSVYVTGRFANTSTNWRNVTFGGQTLNGIAPSNTNGDIFVVKYLDNGASAGLGWAVAAGGTSPDGGTAIAVSGTNVYVAGGFQNNTLNAASVIIGGQPLSGLNNGGAPDAFVAKYVDNGTSAGAGWAVAGGGAGTDSGTGVAVSGSNVYLTGAFQNTTADVNAVRFGGQALAGMSSSTNPDAFVAKYVDNGTSASFGWATAGGGTGADRALGIAARGTGVYVTGQFQNNNANANSATFGGQVLNGITTTPSNQEVFLVKYLDGGAAPSLSWSTAAGGNSSAEIGYGVATQGQKVYVVGAANGTATFGSLALTGVSLRGFLAGLTEPVPAPTLTGLSPATAPVGTTITLTGTDLTGATVVSFNGTAATSFTVNSATQITAIVPAGATTGNVTVTTPGGTSGGVPFTVTLPDLVVSMAQAASGNYNNVTVLSGGVLTAPAILNVAGTLRVEDGGRLLLDPSVRVEGTGNFEVQAGGQLAVTHVEGISAAGATGAVRVTGTRSFASDAIYEFRDPRSNGVTGTGLPATVRELIISGSIDGITLTQPTAVTQVLRLNQGIFDTQNQLTLLSTATRQAYVVHNGGTTSGTVTVQRFIGGPTAAGYRHLSSPVQNTTVNDLATAGFTPQVNAAYNNLPYVAPPLAAFPNVLGYNETRGGTTPAYAGFSTGYFSPTALSDVLTSGRGWSVYMTGALTPDFVGALTTGNVTQALSLTGTNSNPNTQKAGWHLLGNPYAQPIDWDLATVPSGLNSSISVYRTTGGNGGAYLTRANGIGSLPDGVLPVGQAFFARATTATSFTFTNALRVEANPGPVARPRAETRPVLSLRLTDPRHGTADETFLYVQAGATTGEDARFDGLKPGRNVGVPTLASLIANAGEAAVNGLPETALTQPTTVEVTAVLPSVGTYELRVGQRANFGTTPIELLDRLTGTRYDLTQHPTILLTASRANEEVSGRFAVVFNGQRVTGTGAELATAPNALVLFPNPVAGGAEVRIEGVAAGEMIHLLDATGRVVQTSNTATLHPHALASGVYTIRTTGGRTARLVVE